MPLNRRRAREVALQVLYADDLNPQRDLTEADEFLCRRLRDVDPLVNFARGIVSGVRRCRGDIDIALSRQASNWSLDRMAAIDRNLLRLGVYELLHTDTPAPVVLNEVIELAKRFGGRQSHQFVNGVLDKLVPPNRTAANRRPKGGSGGSGGSGDRGGQGGSSRAPAGQGSVEPGTATGTAGNPSGVAARGNSSSQSVTRHGVVSRYGLTVRPRVKEAAGPNTAGAVAAPLADLPSSPASSPASSTASPPLPSDVVKTESSSTSTSSTVGMPAPAGTVSAAVSIVAHDSERGSLPSAESMVVDGLETIESSAGQGRHGHQGKGAADGIV
jgi:N utilization substance protein B